MADSSERLPLNWRRKKTPMRGTRRSKNWQHIFIGGRIGKTRWTLIEGPWRVLKPSGSLSRVRVLCDPQYGGCGAEHVRHLGTIIQGRSTGCLACHHRAQKAAAAARKQEAASGARTEPGQG